MLPAKFETAIHLLLVMGFVAVDFLFFHDVLKPGEVITPAEMLVGALSLLVFFSSGTSLVRPLRAAV